MIVAGRQLDPELREPLAHLARAAGFPILAEPTSQLRCGPHDRSHVVAAYDLLLRDERFAERVAPDLVLRFGEMPTSKPLRAWLAGIAAPTRSSSTPTAAGTSRPGARRRCCAPTRPSWRRAGRRGSATRSAPRPRALARRRARGARGDRGGAGRGGDDLTEPGLHLALGRAHRDGDLVYTASSMPIRDQEAFLPAGRGRRRSSSATAAPTGSTA